MSSFFLPKFGEVDSSFLGFIKDGTEYTILTEATAGPTLNSPASAGTWEYELDSLGVPDPGPILTQRQVVEEKIYPDGTITGYDDTDTSVSDGKTYRWCRWNGSGSITVTYAKPVFTRTLASAGGGGGGSSTGGSQGAGGGGGGGGFLDDFLELDPGTSTVTIGSGGAAGGGPTTGNGGNTEVFGVTLLGGGYGGTPGALDGGDGGSGGGAAFNRATTALQGTPGTGTPGQGYDGRFGGGGAAGAAAHSGSFPRGPGVFVDTPWGSITFCAGGEGEGTGSTGPAGSGQGGDGGWLAYGAASGASGSLYVRYRIA